MMKKLFLLICMFVLHETIAQNVGVGTTVPAQKLEVNGKVRIGNDNALPVAGTMRFNDAVKDFEGFNGTEWKSLTNSYSGAPFIQDNTPNTDPLRLGFSVAVYGDFAVAGMPTSNVSGGQDVGQVNIYKRENSTWRLVQNFSGSALGARYGSAVAINDKYVVIGSPQASSATTYHGKITVLKKVNNLFQFLADIQPGTPIDLERFGTSLSLYGNYLAVGCRGHFNAITPNTKGSVYTYTISNDVFTQRQRIVNPENLPEQDFGVSIAIDSTTLIIGAGRADNLGNTARGKVYVYKNTGSNTYGFSNILEYAPYGNNNDNFGASVGLSGNHLVIGSPGFDIPPFIDMGAIFLCKKDVSGNFLSAGLTIFTHPFDTPNSFFGKSVAIHNNIIIGGGSKTVYQYINNNQTWQYHKMLTQPGITVIDAAAAAINEQVYMIGEPTYFSNTGRIVLGDCRY